MSSASVDITFHCSGVYRSAASVIQVRPLPTSVIRNDTSPPRSVSSTFHDQR
jgi:hypothetical protein